MLGLSHNDLTEDNVVLEACSKCSGGRRGWLDGQSFVARVLH